MGLLLLFLDGVGIGPPGPANPMSRSGSALLGLHDERRDGDALTGLPSPWRGVTIDATLGIPGLPQSATGQTTLLSGVNAAASLGHHQSAHPGRRLREILAEHSLLKRVRDSGRTATFANAYTPPFFEAARSGLPRRSSVSTTAAWYAGQRFRSLDDLVAGQAVFHDVTRETLRERGHDLEPIEPEAAGEHLAGLVRTHAFVFFEHFLTDLIGHARVRRDPVAHLAMLDRFVGAVTSGLDPGADGIVLTSDHGNLEDLSVSSHTRYPVPLLTWGRLTALVDRGPRDLTAVAPGVLAALEDA